MPRLSGTPALQNAQTVTNNGDTINVNNADTLVVYIGGTSTSFTVSFYASLDGVNYYPIEGNKKNNSSILASSTSTTGEAWEFDVSAEYTFQARLTAIGNGNVTVIASAVN